MKATVHTKTVTVETIGSLPITREESSFTEIVEIEEAQVGSASYRPRSHYRNMRNATLPRSAEEVLGMDASDPFWQ
jgi:hypothetical protein